MDELKKLLVDNIISTKMLNSLDFEYVNNKLEKYILTYGDVFKKLKKVIDKKGSLDLIEKNKNFKKIVKDVRDELRIVYGSFLTNDFSKKEKVLENIDNKEDLVEIMKVHKSTNERIEYFSEIYENIFNWYSKNNELRIKKIGDLGCGLNPLSYYYIRDVLGYDFEIFASDLSSDDMNFLQLFFNKFKILGKAKSYDLTDKTTWDKINEEEMDVLFLFKVLDSLETVKKNISKEFLEHLNVKNIVISFPTKSLMSKKQFKMERRNWLFNYINKMNWVYETFEVENELFILLNKN